jgi:hypothetical protein
LDVEGVRPTDETLHVVRDIFPEVGEWVAVSLVFYGLCEVHDVLAHTVSVELRFE